MKKEYKYNRSNYKYQNPENKKSNKLLSFVIIIVCFLLVFGIGYYLYYNIPHTETIKINSVNEALKEDKGHSSNLIITNTNGTYEYNSTTKELKQVYNEPN